ncbi:MAG TPA: penicillin-binding protein 2, partial [Stellaceae bacterium]|nr:penicillin-binding protein 2 [Stellaceae bacterium]
MKGDPRNESRYRVLTRRAAILGIGEIGLFGALAARMYHLQVVEAARYETLAEANRINVRLLAPHRGRILDRFGVPLAINRQNYRIELVPDQAGDIEETLDAIADLIPFGEGDRRRVLRDAKQRHGFVPVVVRDNITWDELARIEVNSPDLPGVNVAVGLTRAYPFAERASHAVGYVARPAESDLDGDPVLELPDAQIGKSGVEKSQDEALRGTAGTSQVEVNALGRVVREVGRHDGQIGADIATTLDMTLQDFAQRRIASEEAATCVVLDAVTGDVLVMASSPSYDANDFVGGIKQEVWDQLNADPHGPLYNKTIQGMYPPGSTFKPTVGLAALEDGLITPDFQVTCTGSITLGDIEFHCWAHDGHGTLDLHGAYKNSCDIYFYEVAKKLGVDRVAAMAHRLGFGAPTGIDIPGERRGLVPTRAWKMATYGVPWQNGETLNIGIGQGYITATPLQLATQVARLVTNRAVVARLFRAEGLMVPGQGGEAGPDHPPLGCQPRNLEAVIRGMDAVCNEPGGTAYGARITDDGMAMGGKSGSAQVRHISAAEREHGALKGEMQLQIPWKERDHALFVAFAPVQAPRYVCSVVVE